MKMKRSNQVFLLSAVLTVGIISFGLWKTGKLRDLLGNEEVLPASHLVWSLAIEDIHSLWNGNIDLGSSIIKKKCPDFYMEKDRIPAELKACRPELFKCFSENTPHKAKIRNKFYSYHFSFDEKSLLGQIKINEKVKEFQFKKSCREVELPQGFYWGNTRKDKSKRVWHTSGVRYLVDRLLVRNIDLREAVLKGGLKEVKEKVLQQKGEELFKPAGYLLPHQMDEYCYTQRQQVLSSRVRLALTFHHGRKKNEDIKEEPPSWNTSPYPFGVRKEDSPNYLVQKGASFKKEFCSKIWAKECLNNADEYKTFPTALGWSGVAELLGGLPEYVRGSEFPRRNIHPSSFYYSLSEKVHEAGIRIFWNGRGHRRVDFNFSTIKPFESNESFFQVGFRCMRMELLR